MHAVFRPKSWLLEVSIGQGSQQSSTSSCLHARKGKSCILLFLLFGLMHLPCSHRAAASRPSALLLPVYLAREASKFHKSFLLSHFNFPFYTSAITVASTRVGSPWGPSRQFPHSHRPHRSPRRYRALPLLPPRLQGLQGTHSLPHHR